MLEEETLFHKGFIPLDEETKEAFILRTRPLLSLNEYTETNSLFDFTLSHIPILFTKEGLKPWEGAAFFQEDNGLGKIHIQPRLPFFYDRKEILTHEMVHAFRLPFTDGPFEEILAYETSSFSWRRWLGPLFFRPSESLLFLLLLLLSVVMQLFTFFIEENPLFTLMAVLLPFLFLLALTFRLMYYRKLFNQSKRALFPFLKNKERTLPVLVRLKTEEILFLAKKSKSEIKDFIFSQHSLRWQLIRNCYFD